MYTRSLVPPRSAFFLLGPRATGKSTWLRTHFGDALWIDLLPPAQALAFSRSPQLLAERVLASARSRWVVIDEIQRVPSLLDGVHDLMENHGYKKFALTGSSARKLKRGAANLLAGRAILRHLYPLTSKELGDAVPPHQRIAYGTLPLVVNAGSLELQEDILRSYVTTYLAEEIKAEALVRNVGSFARCLEVAAIMAGQQVNISGVARDAQVTRDTARGFFEILEDTMIGAWLPAYRARAKVKEVVHPKFYWFDSGVLNAAAGGFDHPPSTTWNGILLEHVVYNELRAFCDYSKTKGDLAYWRTPSGSEIDFIWRYGTRRVAIEVKASTRFRPEFTKGIASFSEGEKLSASYVVYLGKDELRTGATRVLPVDVFLRHLHAGRIIST